jgi:putative DNA primase/helicase
MTSQQLNELVAQTPKEPTRAPKPKLEDFTEYSEEGAKTVHTDEFKQALSDWAEQEREYISNPQHISDMTSTLKVLSRYFMNTVIYI